MEQITKEELLDVIGKFELGDNTEVVSVEPYGSGHINDTFRLEVKEDGPGKTVYPAENEQRYFQKSEGTDGKYPCRLPAS